MGSGRVGFRAAPLASLSLHGLQLPLGQVLVGTGMIYIEVSPPRMQQRLVSRHAHADRLAEPLISIHSFPCPHRLPLHSVPATMSPPKARHDAIPGFRPIAPSIWEHTPSIPTNPLWWKPSLDTPSLIILFSWTGAHGRHVSKYTAAYQTLFPTARILVITTSAKDLCFRSSARKQARLRPAVERILSYDGNGSILVHAFSEGGSNKAAEFAEAYYKITGTRLPCTAVCLDSTPGHPRYLRLCNALAKSLPPNIVFKSIGLFLVSILLGIIWIFYCCFVGYSNNTISQTRGRILDSRYWDLAAPRCYLYSRGDELISWQDVREHMVSSLALGIPVMDVCFERSAHCRHGAEYPERYWDSVVLTWRRAVPMKMGAWKWGVVEAQAIEYPATAVVKEKAWSDTDSERTLWVDEIYYHAV